VRGRGAGGKREQGRKDESHAAKHTARLKIWYAAGSKFMAREKKRRKLVDFGCPVCPTLGIFSSTLAACADIRAFVPCQYAI